MKYRAEVATPACFLQTSWCTVFLFKDGYCFCCSSFSFLITAERKVEGKTEVQTTFFGGANMTAAGDVGAGDEEWKRSHAEHVDRAHTVKRGKAAVESEAGSRAH